MSVAQGWYPSRIDWWIGGALILGPAACVASLIATAIQGDGLVVAIVASVALAVVYIGIVLPMRYAITEDAVVVRHGLVRQRIPLGAISEVRPTRNALSSPALSLDRLAIRFGSGFFRKVMISPADKAGFLAELQAKAGLVPDGDRLVRAAG